MKPLLRNLILTVFLGFFVLVFSSLCFAEGETVAADFDSGSATNNLGGAIEVWLAGDGSDSTQFSKMSFVQDDSTGKMDGQAIKIDYDVDSENPAYNGVRTDLNNFDTTGFKTLNFYIKGDAVAGFAKNLKVELIGENGRPSPAMASGITDQWQKISIPLTDFPMLQEGTKLQKFVVVFADITSDPKVGTIYLDNVFFSKS